MNDAWSIMDIVILVCGVYALYAAYVLKTKGKIIKTFLVFKETDVNTCKDLGAYAAVSYTHLDVYKRQRMQ